MSYFDYAEARAILRFYYGFVHHNEDQLLDRLAGCVGRDDE